MDDNTYSTIPFRITHEKGGFDKEKETRGTELSSIQSQIMAHSSENPLAFWDKEEFMIRLPSVPDDNPTKASHPGMSLADTELCRQEIDDLLAKQLIEPSTCHTT